MKIKNLDKVTPQLPESLGQKTNAESVSVALASDTTLPVTLTLDKGSDVIEADTLRVTVATDDPVLASVQASVDELVTRTPTLGQKNVATSRSVVLASGHADVGVNVTNATLTVTGTVAATQSGAWGVDAVQSGAWSVDAVQSGTWSVEQSGAWTVAITAASLPLPTGAATETTLAAISTKTPALGQAAKAGSVPVTLASDQGNVGTTVSNLPATVATNAGLASASTIRTVIATDQAAIPVSQSGTFSVDVASQPSRQKVALLRLDHTSGGGVTTGAYVQLTANTSGTIRRLHIFDSSGSALYLAVGAAASEVDTIIIPPGGIELIDVTIASGSRLSVKAIDSATSAGQLLITALS